MTDSFEVLIPPYLKNLKNFLGSSIFAGVEINIQSKNATVQKFNGRTTGFQVRLNDLFCVSLRPEFILQRPFQGLSIIPSWTSECYEIILLDNTFAPFGEVFGEDTDRCEYYSETTESLDDVLKIIDHFLSEDFSDFKF